MRHLEQIMEDKRRNDIELNKATKRAAELKTELDQLFKAVQEAAGFNE